MRESVGNLAPRALPLRSPCDHSPITIQSSLQAGSLAWASLWALDWDRVFFFPHEVALSRVKCPGTLEKICREGRASSRRLPHSPGGVGVWCPARISAVASPLGRLADGVALGRSVHALTRFARLVPSVWFPVDLLVLLLLWHSSSLLLLLRQE